MHRRLARQLTCLLLFCFLAVAVFAANYQVYVGTYTGPHSKGIYTFQFDTTTGKFTEPQLAGETENPSFLTVDHGGRFLYSVNETENYKGTSSGAVSVFSINPSNAKLTFLQQLSSLGGAPAYLSLDKSGQDLLVANYSGGNVVVFPVHKDGRLGEHTANDQHKGSSVNPDRQKGPHAHSVQMSNDNRFALSADLGLDKVIIDRFDPARGTLTANNPPFAKVEPGSGPRHLAFAPSGKFVYALSEMGTTVTVFSYDPRTAAMHKLQTIATVAEHNPENTAAEIQFDSKGRFLYTSTRGAENSIAQFAVDSSTGKLKLVARTPSGGKTPRFFTLDPSGHWMFVANQDSDNIALFKVDKKTGKLTPTDSQMKLGSPVCLVFVTKEAK